MYATLSFGPFRAKAACTAVGKLNQRKQQERICFPKCYVLSWLKLCLSFIPGKKRKYMRSEGRGGWTVSDPGSPFTFATLRHEAKHPLPLKEGPALSPTCPLWWPGISSSIAGTHPFGEGGQMMKWDQGREEKKRGSWKTCPTRIIGIWGKKAARIIDCPKPKRVSQKVTSGEI